VKISQPKNDFKQPDGDLQGLRWPLQYDPGTSKAAIDQKYWRACEGLSKTSMRCWGSRRVNLFVANGIS